MQTSVPELTDISQEPAPIHAMYGTRPGEASFANNCLLARRLVERGVRFVQLYHWGWDTHGNSVGTDIVAKLPRLCREVDRPIGALLTDLKQRGLLDDTLVVWGGEFGRTPMNEGHIGYPILAPLCSDPAKCVRDSVANWLNDASKSQPAWVQTVCEHWMRRRHPRKTLRWCYRKYLTTVGNRSYVLQATFLDRRGKPRTLRLFKAADVPIKRHVKIKAAANPFLPEWESYFEERIALQMKDSCYGYDKLLRLWFKQDGICPHCGQKITRDTGWNLHHRVQLVDGGDDSMTNLLLLHPTCHQQLHAQTNRVDHLCNCAAFSLESV